MSTSFRGMRRTAALPLLFVVTVLCLLLLSGCSKDAGDPVENDLAVSCGEKGPVYPFADEEGAYHLVIPSDWSADTLTFTAETDAYAFTLNGSGIGAEGVGMSLAEDEPCTLTVTDGKGNTVKDTTLTVSRSRIPSVCIRTASGSMDAVHADKTYREKGTAAVTLPDGTAAYDGALSWIHGHGNSTWAMKKKSYTIKFPHKVELLGLEGKKFCLLANWADASRMRNWAVYKTLLQTDMTGAVDCTHAALWLNGHFNGLYLVTEKIDVGRSSIPITEQKEPVLTGNEKLYVSGKDGQPGSFRSLDIHSPEGADVTGGYLLELFLADRYGDEAGGFVSENGQHVIIKSPENPTVEQAAYISGLYQEIEDALLAPDGVNPKTGRHYSDYVDVRSFALLYLYEELTQDIDAGQYSIYLYKDSDRVDGKVYAGPLWDFDLTLGNELNCPPFADPSWPVSLTYRKGETELLRTLRDRKDFTDTVCALYRDEVRGLFSDFIGGKVFGDQAEAIRHDAALDTLLWGREDRYQAELDDLTVFTSEHLAFLDGYLGHEDEFLTVRADTDRGGQRIRDVFFYAVRPGQTVSLPDMGADADFLGWYVDGTGERFDPDAPLTGSVSVTARYRADPKARLISLAKAVYHRIIAYLPILLVCAAASAGGVVYLIVRHRKKKKARMSA